VHRLKYQAIAAAALPLAHAMAPAAADGGALIPVPRAVARRWRHGVDPARELAAAIGRLTGVPVVAALAPGWWHAARAGPGGRERGIPRFRAVGSVPDRWVLVDDVVTTGATLLAAARALGGGGTAVVATAAQAGGVRCR
jgi:predicted amidophosphoribosyltransferase